MRTMVNIFVCLQQLGICCVYFNFVSTNLKAIIPVTTWNDPKNEARELDLMAFPIFALLAQVRLFSGLAV